jgi:hypothetical protein
MPVYHQFLPIFSLISRGYFLIQLFAAYQGDDQAFNSKYFSDKRNITLSSGKIAEKFSVSPGRLGKSQTPENLSKICQFLNFFPYIKFFYKSAYKCACAVCVCGMCVGFCACVVNVRGKKIFVCVCVVRVRDFSCAGAALMSIQLACFEFKYEYFFVVRNSGIIE